MKIITIGTMKGGVLKTSITTNLAGILSKPAKISKIFGNTDKKVLIIDTDPQGNAALTFGLNPDNFNFTLYDVLVYGYDPNDAIINLAPNLDILPSNDDLGFYDVDVLTKPDQYPEPFTMLREAIKRIKTDYDYILIDTPPSLSLTQASALVAADSLIIPFQPEQYSMRSLVKMINTVMEIQEKYNPRLEILGVLPTLVDPRTNLHNQVLDQTREYCYHNNIYLFKTQIKRSVQFASHVAYENKPATMGSDYTMTTTYRNITKEMKSRWQEVTKV